MRIELFKALHYKKPAFWILLVVVLACIALAAALLKDRLPIGDQSDSDTSAAFGWTASVPNTEENSWFSVPTQDDWTFTNPSETAQTTFDAERTLALREKYPEYFALDTMKGLEVYVWQMSPVSYLCGVMSGTNRDKTLEELMNLKGATIAEMRAILSTYDIDEKDVSVIPWQNPVSSYLGPYWISLEEEDSASEEARKQAYIDELRQMLFGKTLPTLPQQTGNTGGF